MKIVTFHDKLMEIGADLVVETVEAIAEGNIRPIPQTELTTEMEVKHAPKIFKEDCLIDWQKPGEQIKNLIRGLSPYPAAWFNLTHANPEKNLTCKVFEAFFEPVKSDNPGTLQSDGKKHIKIACKDGWINLTDLQIAGKKRMPVQDLLRGFSFEGYSAL